MGAVSMLSTAPLKYIVSQGFQGFHVSDKIKENKHMFYMPVKDRSRCKVILSNIVCLGRV